jgi:hypothetical protein
MPRQTIQRRTQVSIHQQRPILVFLLILGAALAPSSCAAEDAQAPTPIPLPEGFKAIVNEQYGFSLQVPEDWVVESPAYGSESLAGPEFYGDEHFVLGLSPGAPHGDWPSIVTVRPGSVEDLLSNQEYRWREHWVELAREPTRIGGLYGTLVRWENGASTRHLEHPSGRYSLTFEGFPISEPETDPELARQWQTALDSVRFLD